MKKVFKLNNLLQIIIELKKEEKIVGFANGCFDLLHKGHIFLLSEAKKNCDFLIVGLNSDFSVKSLKGKSRPIDNEKNRIDNLLKKTQVDAIILFSEDTPINLITNLSPNILFKGSDYINKEVVGSSYIKEKNGKTIFINIIDGYSTTNIINKSSINS